jgi:hypothetical protein
MAKITNKSSLVGRLFDVSIGDIIELSDNQTTLTSVSGFVVRIEPEEVVLSHESPFNDRSMLYARKGTGLLGKGDRKYELAYFNRYCVVKKHNPEEYVKKELEAIPEGRLEGIPEPMPTD